MRSPRNEAPRTRARSIPSARRTASAGQIGRTYGISFERETEKNTKTRPENIQRNPSVPRAFQAARERPGQVSFQRPRNAVHGRNPARRTRTK